MPRYSTASGTNKNEVVSVCRRGVNLADRIVEFGHDDVALYDSIFLFRNIYWVECGFYTSCTDKNFGEKAKERMVFHLGKIGI